MTNAPIVGGTHVATRPGMRGRRLGRYELLSELGTGGMATVWLSRVCGPGGFERHVAIKRIHTHLLRDARFVDMFLDEARIAARVQHPNVCPVFDFGEHQGTFYIAMEHVDGASWTDVRTALDDDEAQVGSVERQAFVARIAADAADGLHAAHEACDPDGIPLDVVHRDVAPANLYVRWDGVVQVLDFGCARARSSIFRSSFGEARGHVAYVAPEVLRGKEPDRRADVWSLGVVMWEMLTGRRLFERTAIHDTLFAVADAEVLPPSLFDASIPEELDRIVMRALERDPADRWSAARDVSRALRRFLHTLDVPMEAPDVAELMRRLFPSRGGKKPRPSRDRDGARDEEPSAGPLPVLLPAPRSPWQPILTELRAAVRSRPVIAAMVLGLAVGLGGTFIATRIGDPAAPDVAAGAPAAADLPGVPRAIAVPHEEIDDAHAAARPR